MGDTAIVIIGVSIGLLLGMSGIASIFDLMTETISHAEEQLSQLTTLSTVALIVVALVFIVMVRLVSSLAVGVIMGAVLNIILEVNNIDVVDQVNTGIGGQVGSTVLNMLV